MSRLLPASLAVLLLLAGSPALAQNRSSSDCIGNPRCGQMLGQKDRDLGRQDRDNPNSRQTIGRDDRPKLRRAPRNHDRDGPGVYRPSRNNDLRDLLQPQQRSQRSRTPWWLNL